AAAGGDREPLPGPDAVGVADAVGRRDGLDRGAVAASDRGERLPRRDGVGAAARRRRARRGRARDEAEALPEVDDAAREPVGVDQLLLADAVASRDLRDRVALLDDVVGGAAGRGLGGGSPAAG